MQKRFLCDKGRSLLYDNQQTQFIPIFRYKYVTVMQ